ncbi:NAD-dependent epimerase/dehydratase family protein [Pseudonocardia nigra]|uniref:NAD-dependent epimerase/dehydratase family protein n=1 Tax=Pseudonocardia nigra TaxID=1921578 RepID=UPI001C5F65BB|nr:NAD(P)-dependent oxidoreductase [Pseudonocardia nigra]
MTPIVLVTGAAGRLGTYLHDRPPPGWTPRWTDLAAAEGIAAADVTDLEAMTGACRGATAVVHLAGIPTDADWPDLLHVNVTGTRTVLEAAHRQGVRRVVLAGSNHAVGFSPRGSGDLVEDPAPRPDSAYGFTKAAVEALGRWYADRGLEVVTLRIGSCRDRPNSTRMLGTWLSPADFSRLIGAALDGPVDGAALVWGVSANTRRWWSPDAGARLGYRPRDDAESHAASVDPGTAGPGDDRVGGRLPPAQASQPGRTRPVS